MPIQNINTGSSANAGNGDSIRLAFDKVNRNFSFVQSNLDSLSAGNFTSLRVTTTATLNNLTVTGTTYLNSVESASFYNNTYLENIIVSDKSTLNHVTATDVTVTGNAKIDTLDVLTSLSVGSYQIAAINDYDDFSIIKNDATGLAVVLLNTNADSNSKLVVKDNISGGLAILHQNVTNLAGDFVSGENYIYGETPTDVIHIGAYSDIKFSASQAKYYNPSLPETPSVVIQSIDGAVHVYSSATFHGAVYGITGIGTLDRLTSQDLSKVVILNNNGSLVPSANLTYDLGSTSSQWRSLYVGTSTIYLGGTALSVAGGVLTVNGSPVTGGGSGSGDRLTAQTTTTTATFVLLADGTIKLTHPTEWWSGAYSLEIQKAAGNYHTFKSAYGLSLQAAPVPNGYGLNTNTNFVDIFHDGVSVNVNDNTWTFGTDGKLAKLDGLTLTAGGQFNICTIVTSGSGYNTGSALKATTGGSGTGMTVGIGYGLSNQLANVGVVNPGTGYVDGDVITVSGGTGGTFVITRYNELANQANNNFVQSNWTFGTDGKLLLPGSSAQIVVEDYGVRIGTGNLNTAPSNHIRIGGADHAFEIFGGPPGYSWKFDTNGGLTLPQGSTIGETTSTTIITPPGASAGQSLVLRGTSPTGITSDHPSGFAPGDIITITVIPDNSNQVTGTIDYTFTGCTEVQLGRALTGTLTFTSESSQTVTWTVPALSGMTTFTFTLSNPSGIGLAGITTLTLTRTSSSEDSHIHIVAGNTATVDLYLGDDDQYVKIEKNHGNVVIGTSANTSTYNWTFGTDGKTSLASGVEISNTSTFNFLSWNTGTALIIADVPYDAGSFIYIPSSSDTASALGIVNTNTSGTIMVTQGSGNTENRLYVNNSGTTINNILGGVSKTWTFGTDGKLTFPNATVQTTAYTGLTPNGTKASTDTGTAGQTSYDSQYFYVCVATNSWRRMALSLY